MDKETKKDNSLEEQVKQGKWRLEDIFESDYAFEQEFSKVQEDIKKIAPLKGTLCDSAANLLNGLSLMNDIERRAEKLYVYAHMRKDEDNSSAKYQTLSDRALGLLVRLEGETSFVQPELIKVDKSTIEDFIKAENGLSVFAFELRDLQRQKPHILDEKCEKILAMSGEVANGPSAIFRMLNNVDLEFGSVVDKDGKEIIITHGSYRSIMESKDRNVRKQTFEKLYDAYKNSINTIGATYSTSVKKDIFYAKAREFDSALEGSLFQDNVSIEVYNTLIDTVHDNLDSLHRYVRLRKKALGIDELKMYDMMTPLISDVDMDIEYDQACKMVLEGIAPLGDEYVSIAKEAFSSGWVDVHEKKGKTSGAYSWGHYDTHPYILLNYQTNLESVFTIAHELGHAMHSYYSNNNQHYNEAGYPILLAEVASTVNETLLLQHMLKNTKDENVRLYLLNHYLDQIRGTVFRQVMFAEFERDTHQVVEQGGALPTEKLSQMYGQLNERYYGDSVETDERISMEWARIPHFYSAFYVYKYATGFSSAIQISKSILEGEEGAKDGYIAFLKSGGSDYPLNTLKKAGVDLTSKQPVQACMQEFSDVLDEMEPLISK